MCLNRDLVLWKKNLPGRGLTKVEKHWRNESLYRICHPGRQACDTRTLNCVCVCPVSQAALHKTSYERFVIIGLPNGQTDGHAEGNRCLLASYLNAPRKLCWTDHCFVNVFLVLSYIMRSLMICTPHPIVFG